MDGGVLYVASGSAFSELSYNEREKKLHEASDSTSCRVTRRG